MVNITFRATALTLALASLGGISSPSFAQTEEAIEEVVTIGSRRQARSASDTVAPVDVILSLIHI